MSKQFFEQTKGHMGQYEDWWRYNQRTDEVTHTWSHVTVNDLNVNEGSNTYSSADFLSGRHNQGAQAALKKILASNKGAE